MMLEFDHKAYVAGTGLLNDEGKWYSASTKSDNVPALLTGF